MAKANSSYLRKIQESITQHLMPQKRFYFRDLNNNLQKYNQICLVFYN